MSMSVSQIREQYQQARQRWETVDWPMNEYSNHIGEENPPHPIDLYLGGAAGHRVDSAWVVMETQLKLQVCRIVSKLPTADMAVEDLWSEAITKQMADDGQRPVMTEGRRMAKIIRYRGLIALENYLVTACRRIAIQRHRKRKPVLFATLSEEDRSGAVGRVVDTETPDEQAGRREMVDKLAAALKNAWANLPAKEQFVLVMVYQQGMQQKRAGTCVGWLEAKTSRRTASAIGALREAITDAVGGELTPALAAAWCGLWSRCWQTVQGAPTDTSNAAKEETTYERYAKK